MPLPSEDLEPLVTECPNCQTRFRVSESQLQVANGRVRCGACLKVFLGTDYLQWDREPVADDRAPDDALDELLGELEQDAPTASQSVRWFDDVAIAEGASEIDFADAPDHQLPSPQEVVVDVGVMPQHYAPVVWAGDAANDAAGGPAGEADVRESLQEEPPAAELTADELLADLTEQLPEADVSPALTVAERVEVVAAAEQPDAEVLEDATATDDAMLPKADETSPRADEAPAAERQDIDQPPAEPPEMVQPEPVAASSPLDVQLPPGGWDVAPLEAEPPPPRRRWPYVAGALLLVFLVAQAVYLLWPSMEKTPEQRWLPETVCAVTGCELEPLRDVDQLVLNNVIVRGHPEQVGVLVVDVLFVNAADFPQAWPDIELSFNTNAGQLVAWRRFKPEEYLAGSFAGSREIAAKTPAHVSVEIKDPGPGSDRYEVSLR